MEQQCGIAGGSDSTSSRTEGLPLQQPTSISGDNVCRSTPLTSAGSRLGSTLPHTLGYWTLITAPNLDCAALQGNGEEGFHSLITSHRVLQNDSVSPGERPALLFLLCQKINETIYWKVES